MKMFGSFCAGALAGFLLGSTKRGCAVRENVDDLIKGFFSGEPATEALEKGDKAEEPLKREAKIKLRKPAEGNKSGSEFEGNNLKEDIDFAAPVDNGPLGIEKATELAEKLGAKVAEIQGDESLPHSHHIDIPINKLSA